MIMRNILKILILCLPLSAMAEVAVIVHSDNVNAIDEVEIRKIFMGKVKSMPNGEKPKVFALPDNDPVSEEFRDKVLKKSLSRMNSYWARMLFSSKGKPPKVLEDADAIKQEVASNPAAIAYIDSDDVDASVRVIFKVK